MIFKALSYWIFGATVAYVMGWFKKKDEREPYVLHGDPKTTNRLINGCPFDNPLTSFINSFASRVSRTQLKQLILIQLAILLPGIPRWHYNFLAVAHKEKCKTGGTRSAVHTVMPNIHLPTGKRLQPYWHWSDKRTVEAGQEIYNLQHNLPSPKQYEHVFGVDIYSEKPNTRRRAFIIEVQKHLIEIYRKGNLRSLADVRTAIEEPFSCQVVHNGRSKKRGGFISVECPAVTKNRIRLYGRLFDPDFLANHGAGDMRKAELSDSERDALIEHYRRVLTEGIIKKYEDYKKKYALGP